MVTEIKQNCQTRLKKWICSFSNKRWELIPKSISGTIRDFFSSLHKRTYENSRRLQEKTLSPAVKPLFSQISANRTPAPPKTLAEKLDEFDTRLQFYINLEAQPAPSLTQQQRIERREFLRRLDKEELREKCISLCQLRPLDPVEKMALQRQDWEHPLFNNPLLSQFALREFIYGRLDRWQIADLLLYHECRNLNRETSEAYPLLLSNGERNQPAIEVLKRSLKVVNGFTDEEIERFLQKIETLSPNQTQFYTNKTENWPASLYGNLLEFLRRIRKLSCFILDDETNPHLKGHLTQVVIPPLMLTYLYRAKYGEQARLPNPILGDSKSIENFKHYGIRDVLIPCGGAEPNAPLFPKSTPVKADGHSMPPLLFYHHDAAYHLLIDSANPHRKIFIGLANQMEQRSQKNPALKIKGCYLELLDGDFPEYLTGRQGWHKGMIFWQSILYAAHLGRGMNPQFFDDKSFEAYLKEIINYLQNRVGREHLEVSLRSLDEYLDAELDAQISYLEPLRVQTCVILSQIKKL